MHPRTRHRSLLTVAAPAPSARTLRQCLPRPPPFLQILRRTTSFLKVELKLFVLSILDDPIVSRVLSEAGFRSCHVKLALLQPPPPPTVWNVLPSVSSDLVDDRRFQIYEDSVWNVLPDAGFAKERVDGRCDGIRWAR
ncbi:hypothetical protein RIF29_28560 [Crotalaria pallida]|uniref:Uncharacterized protein n=1 Tax=Crotalaria pallida TaxID=3830 RepID=A0AAN9ED70_CROPI